MKPKTQKQNEAVERQTIYDALPIQKKIANCKTRRGNSKRELAKLTKG